jgi:GH25 family lysozyme M1 (1,4-beta-N-acetylmuramidase)
VSIPERLRKPVLARRAAAMVAATALAAGTLAYAATTASAATTSRILQGRAAANSSAHWAVTVTGRKVLVPKPKFVRTPIRPGKLTHPGRDDMGLVTSAHEHWRGHAVRPNAAITSGIDVSSYQGDIDWANVCPHVGFVYAKATEGTYYTNPYFTNQYEGPYDCGVIRGAYHFGIPPNAEGNTQADYFIAHGGGWSGDGLTLPGALDIEYNPYPNSYGNECYDFSQSQMVSWLTDFINEYAYREHVYPVIYSTTDWWSTCTGNYGGFANEDPLWIANYNGSPGTLPNGWGFYTFWQYADSGSLPGDQDSFNGAYSRLQVLAKDG